MTIDLATPRSIDMTAERPVTRAHLLRIACLLVMAADLMLKAAVVMLGGIAARAIAPSLLSVTDLSGVVLAYLTVATLEVVIGRMTGKSPVDAKWLLWLALLLGLAATRDHDIRTIEAICLWFIIVQIGSPPIGLVLRRLTETILHAMPQSRTVAFLGNSNSAAMTLTQLMQNRHSHVRVLGFFDDRLSRSGPLTGLIPCLGTIDDLVGYIHEAELSEVYMALPWSAGPRISHLLERLRFLPLTVRLVPDHVPPALPGRGDGQLYGVVMPTLMLPPFSTANAFFKRAMDICAAAILLVPLIPLFIVVAICVKLDSPGPVFFRQIRSGQFGRPFQIFKFRSLHVAQADTTAETLVTTGDRRVTRVGQVIRKYSVDELPQIFNVLVGQMSLVGPRPHAPRAKADGRIYAEVVPEYMLRYRVKPGMTGWAQVNGWRGNTDTEEQLRKRVEFDFQYIGKWSIWKDLEIIVRTIPAMLLPPTQNV